MAGLEQVYLRQAGTGSAALLGQSSWDPVQFAKYSTGLKAAQEAAQEQKKQKTKDALLKDLAIKPSKGIAEDRNAINNFGDAFMYYKADRLLKEGREPNQNDWNEGVQFKQEWDQLEQDSQLQDKAITGYLGQIKGNDKLDNEAMKESGAKFSNPELFMDEDPYIQETFTPILEYYMKDDFYGQDPERALVRAKAHWRNDDGRKYVTEPIYKPVNLIEHWSKVGIPLIAENKEYLNQRTIDGTEITREYLYKLEEDQTVKLENGKTVKLLGSRHIADDFYNTMPDISQSANRQFNELDESTKEDYVSQFGEDAAKEYYKDLVGPYGTEATQKESNKAPLPKTGTYRFGNKTHPFEVVADEGEFNYNRLGVFSETTVDDKGKEKEDKGIVYSYAKVPMQGLAFGSDKNKYPKIKVNPLNIFNQDSYSWMNSDQSQEFDFTVSGTYRAPALTQDVDIDDPRLAGFKKWAYQTYGAKANTAISKIFNNKAGVAQKYTPVSKQEADELNKAIPGLVDTQYFASGQIQGYDQVNQKSIEIPAATIPLEQIKERLAPATNDADWQQEIDDYYGPEPDWWKKTVVVKGGKENANSGKKQDPKVDVDPNKTIKEKITERTKTPDLDDDEEGKFGVKKTPFGKEYDSEDAKGYYFMGRMIEEKGR